jgi:hypothetical protein
MSDTRWLTYDELGEALGIHADSARRLVARKKWPRKQNNEGRALIAVPDEYLERERPPVVTPDVSADDSQDDSPDNSDDVGPDITHGVRILTQHIERLEKDLEAVKAERDTERARAAALSLQAAQVEVLKTLLDTERKRIEEVRETERQRVEEWKAVADRFAAQTEQMLTAQARRSWWPWRRSA